MSKPITRPKPASAAVSTMPTTPPAGPERIASLPRKCSAAVSPPEDIMNCSVGPGSPGGVAPSAAATRAT